MIYYSVARRLSSDTVVFFGSVMIAPIEAFAGTGMEAVLDKKAFGARVKELREAAGLSQKELAERVGVSQRAVSHWEQELREPGILIAPALAEALGVELDALFIEPKEVPEPRRGRPRKDQGEPPAAEGPKKGKKPKGK
jgi:transcriptional regulator with XRE-family HTH domain